MEGKRPRVCKICNRKFANGKAMGGHMRSHLVKLPVPPKTALLSSSSSPPSLEDYPSPTITTVTFPSSNQSPDLNQPEVEGNCFRYLTGKRGKRRSKLLYKVLLDGESPSDSVSSFHDEVLTIEEAAMCLIKLSQDEWPRYEGVTGENMNINVDIIKNINIDAFENSDMDVVGERMLNVGEQENNDEDWECIHKRNGKPRMKYKCESCNKLFKSHQALGGHRAANHKNKQIRLEKLVEEKTDDKMNEVKVFACPYCNKVFPSGQALGGHKKIHFTYLTVVEDTSSAVKVSDDTSSASSTVQLLDLNLPAPEDGHEC